MCNVYTRLQERARGRRLVVRWRGHAHVLIVLSTLCTARVNFRVDYYVLNKYCFNTKQVRND